MTNASILSSLAHATPTPTSRSKGQKSRWGGGGAYCGGDLAAQLVINAYHVAMSHASAAAHISYPYEYIRPSAMQMT